MFFIKKMLTVALVITISSNLVAFNFKQAVTDVRDGIVNTTISARDGIVDWWSELDFTCFKEGFEYAGSDGIHNGKRNGIEHY